MLSSLLLRPLPRASARPLAVRALARRLSSGASSGASSAPPFSSFATPSSRPLSTSVPGPTILFMGAGNMSSAMIRPLLTSKIFATAPTVLFSEIANTTRAKVAKDYPAAVDVTDDLPAGLAEHPPDIVVVAVKPQNCVDLFKLLRAPLAALEKPPTVLSICAGVPIASFAAGLGTDRVVRSMPNTPAMIERGTTVWCPSGGGRFSEEELGVVQAVIGSFGTEIRVSDEKLVRGGGASAKGRARKEEVR